MDALLAQFTSQLTTHAKNVVVPVQAALPGWNIALLCMFVATVLCYVPHVVKASRVLGSGKVYSLKQPRVSVELAMKDNKAAMSIARAQASHQNQLEVFPIFAAGVLAALYAGVSGPLIDAASLYFVAMRVLHIFFYCWGTQGWMASMRSLVWFQALFACGYLHLAAASQLGPSKHA